MSCDPDGRKPLIVEFVGTPGSGKTTLAGVAVGLLEDHGVAAGLILDLARMHAARTLPGRAAAGLARGRLRRALLWRVFYVFGLIHAVRFGIEHRALALHVLRTQRSRPIPPALKSHILYWFFQLGGRVRFLTSGAHAREALVLDDGFLHRAVHLHASHHEAPNGRRVAAYVDGLPAPDLVVFVTTSIGVCERRVHERGVWAHSAHLTQAQLSRYLRNADQVARLAAERARARGWTVMEVENGTEGEHARDNVRRALAPLICGRTGA